MDASDHAAGDERLTENQMLRMALDNMPHGLCMFDGADRLLPANRRFAQLWDIPEELTRPGTSYATNKAAVKGFEMCPTAWRSPIPLQAPAACVGASGDSTTAAPSAWWSPGCLMPRHGLPTCSWR